MPLVRRTVSGVQKNMDGRAASSAGVGVFASDADQLFRVFPGGRSVDFPHLRPGREKESVGSRTALGAGGCLLFAGAVRRRAFAGPEVAGQGAGRLAGGSKTANGRRAVVRRRRGADRDAVVDGGPRCSGGGEVPGLGGRVPVNGGCASGAAGCGGLPFPGAGGTPGAGRNGSDKAVGMRASGSFLVLSRAAASPVSIVRPGSGSRARRTSLAPCFSAPMAAFRVFFTGGVPAGRLRLCAGNRPWNGSRGMRSPFWALELPLPVG